MTAADSSSPALTDSGIGGTFSSSKNLAMFSQSTEGLVAR